jgi:hypothetical protein
LGKVSSMVCLITEDRELIECGIKTDCDHLHGMLGQCPPSRIVIESSTESE